MRIFYEIDKKQVKDEKKALNMARVVAKERGYSSEPTRSYRSLII